MKIIKILTLFIMFSFSSLLIADSNVAAAHACQKGGWKNLRTSSGESFKNTGDCISYIAQGGEFQQPTITITSPISCINEGDLVRLQFGFVITGYPSNALVTGTILQPLGLTNDTLNLSPNTTNDVGSLLNGNATSSSLHSDTAVTDGNGFEVTFTANNVSTSESLPAITGVCL